MKDATPLNLQQLGMNGIALCMNYRKEISGDFAQFIQHYLLVG